MMPNSSQDACVDDPTLLIAVVTSVGSFLLFLVAVAVRRKILYQRDQIRRLEEDLSDSKVLGSRHVQDSELAMVHKVMSEEEYVLGLRIDGANLSLKSLVGKGSFGEVYEAIYNDPKSGLSCPVAVKTIRSLDNENIIRFRSEIIMLSQLHHPNIVELKGCVWDRGMVAMVMDLVTNGTVGEALVNPSLTLTWADPKLRMVLDAVTGMVYLHSKAYYDYNLGGSVDCVIHRDLKPANMMLTPTFLLKLTDFGEARAKDMDATMTMVGTPLYLAPEIVRGDRYDEKVDTFSFGMTLFELSVVVPKERLGAMVELQSYSPMHAIPKNRNAESLYAMLASELKRVKGESLVSANKLVNLLSNGFRPEIPDYVPRSIATLIQECWDPVSDHRPPFTRIREVLTSTVSMEVFQLSTSPEPRGLGEGVQVMARNRAASRLSQLALNVNMAPMEIAMNK